MSERPILSNPNIGGDEVYPSLPTVYTANVDDPRRAAGLGGYVKNGILRFWRKVQGSYRYIGAKRTTFAPRSGTETQTVAVVMRYEPSELNPLVWLEGGDQLLETPNVGTEVALWADRSGNENSAFQNVPANRPYTGGANVGLFKSVNFNSWRILDLPLSGITQPMTVVALATFPADLTVGKTLMDGSAATFRIQRGTDGKLSLNAGVGLVSAGALAAGPHIIVAVMNGANSSLRVDGVVSASGNIGTNNPDGFYIGNDRTFASPFNGELFAFMMFDRVLSPMEILLVENYLAQEGFLTANLPSTAIKKNGIELSPAWTPAVWEGKIAAWFKADSITGKVHGNAISQWNDLSGNARHAVQSTAVNQPLYDTSTGFPAVDFDGVNDSLVVPAPAGLYAQPYTIAAVWNPANSAIFSQYLVSHQSGSPEIFSNAAGKLYASAGVNQNATITRGGNLFSIVTFDDPGGQTIIDNNGVQTTLPSSGSADIASAMNIGINYNQTTSPLNGTISELIILPFVVTPEDRRNLEGYFFWKYGISSPTAPWTNAGPMQPYFDDPWTPGDLTLNMKRMWLEADAISGLANGAAVAFWSDSSKEGGGASQGTPTDQPAYKNPGSLNGLASVDFDGSTDRLNTSLSAGQSSETILVVLDADVITGTRAILGAAANGGRTLRLNSGVPEVLKQGVASLGSASVGVSVNTPTIISVEISPTTVTFGKNGTIGSPVVHAQVFVEANTYVSSSSAGEWFDGEIFEIISLGAISTGTRQLIEGYLAWKWGVAKNLPSTHPYRFSRPNFSDLGESEFGWTMEIWNSIGGIEGTGYLARDIETLGPDGTTDFSTGDGPNIIVSMPSRMMYLWPREDISGYYYHDYGVSGASKQARLLKRSQSGEYFVVAESNLLSGNTDGELFATTWAILGFPSLEWNAQYALEWRATDSNGFVSGWHGASYFATDATPLRPINLMPSGDAVTGYPLITFFAEDPDDAPGAPMGRVWPFTYLSKATGMTNPKSMAQEVTSGNILIVDGSRILSYNSALSSFIQSFGSSGAGNGQFYGLTSVDVDESGLVSSMVTSETTNLRVQKMTRSIPAGSYAYANKIATDAIEDLAVYAGNVYIAQNYGIGIIPVAALTPITKWAIPNRYSVKVAINQRRGWLYVIGAYPFYVTAYDIATREELFSFGGRGTGPGEFAVASTGGGNFEIDQNTEMVYWLDEGNNVLQVYDYLGNILAIYNMPQGSGDGQFSSARSMLFSRDGKNLYISAGFNRVQRLSIKTDAELALMSVLNAEVLVSYPVTEFGKYDTSTEGVPTPAAAGYTASLAWDGTVGNKEAGSLKVTISAAPASTTTGLIIYPFAQMWPVVPGEEYAFEIAVRCSSPLLNFTQIVRWYDASSGWISKVYNNDMGDNLEYTAYGVNDFLTLSTSGFAPSDAAFAECYVLMYRTTAAAFSGPQYVWIDDANFGGDARFLKEATHIGSGNFSWQPTATEMNANRTYKISARGKDAVQVGPWSDVAIIQKVNGPTVIVDSPASGQVFQSVSPIILWRVTSGSQWAFQVQIYDVATLGIAYDSGWVQSESARSFSVPPGYLDDGGSYFLRMGIDDGTIKALV